MLYSKERREKGKREREKERKKGRKERKKNLVASAQLDKNL
jgi:hypothetical protein